MPVNFRPEGVPSHCTITYTISCPAGAGASNRGGGIYAPPTSGSSIDALSTTALPDVNDETLEEEEDSVYEVEEDEEEDEELDYDDDIDEAEIQDLLDEDYEEEEEDDFEYEPGDEGYVSSTSTDDETGIEGCQQCNVRLYKAGIQGGYDPDNLRFRDANGKFLRDP
jgi:hypothetical protein